MGLSIKASDLKYRYPRAMNLRHLPKFQGKCDPAPFNRNDLFDVIPLLEAVMDELGQNEGRVLHLVEDVMNKDLPRFVQSRGEVFRFLTGCVQEILENR